MPPPLAGSGLTGRYFVHPIYNFNKRYGAVFGFMFCCLNIPPGVAILCDPHDSSIRLGLIVSSRCFLSPDHSDQVHDKAGIICVPWLIDPTASVLSNVSVLCNLIPVVVTLLQLLKESR